jgi:hypothetical protein
VHLGANERSKRIGVARRGVDGVRARWTGKVGIELSGDNSHG